MPQCFNQQLDAAIKHMPTCINNGEKEQRKVARAFADSDGPEICYEIESCMKGDWVKDAKNGTMSALSKISRLPGPIGQVCSARG